MRFWLCVVCIWCLLTAVSGDSTASPLQPCYTPAELVRIRQWEKIWAGRKIDAANIHEVSELLPQSFVEIYQTPERWGAHPDGLFFFIVPYRPAAETAGMHAATRQHSPGLRVGDDGTLPRRAEIAGRPFPSPRTGIEAAWNYDFNTHGDSCFYSRTGTNINPRTRTEKTGDQDAWELYWINRVDVEPLPAFGRNPKGISKSTLYHMYSPPEFRNIRMLNLRHIDQLAPDATYMWLSAFRRIQRISSADRTDTIDGTDLIYDDEYGWDGQILRNTYRLAGEKELLCARHVSIEKTERRSGQALLNNISRERTKTLVVEVFSKDPHYLYGKRIWYLDPETYLIAWTEIYDRHMRFWKCFENLASDVQTGGGELKNFIVGAHYIDYQRIHAGIWENRRIEVGQPLSNDLFTLHNLQKGGY